MAAAIPKEATENLPQKAINLKATAKKYIPVTHRLAKAARKDALAKKAVTETKNPAAVKNVSVELAKATAILKEVATENAVALRKEALAETVPKDQKEVLVETALRAATEAMAETDRKVPEDRLAETAPKDRAEATVETVPKTQKDRIQNQAATPVTVPINLGQNQVQTLRSQVLRKATAGKTNIRNPMYQEVYQANGTVRLKTIKTLNR